MAGEEFYRLKLVLEVQDRISEALSRPRERVQQMERSTDRARQSVERLGRTRAEPIISLRDRASAAAHRIEQSIRGIAMRTWVVTLRVRDFASGAINKVRTSLSGIMRFATSMPAMIGLGAVTIGPAALVGSAVKTAAGFEQAMANVASVAGASSEELARLTATAEEMGRTTRFRASEAADALYYLASAGFSVDEQISALKGTLDLAAATQADLAFTSETLASTLSSFGLQASDADRVANVFAATISKSQATIEKLADSMRYAGPIASGFGISVEQTAAALGLLYNAGLRGEQAGTTLRAALTAIANPTGQTKDAMQRLGLTADQINPALHSLAEIIGTLETRNIDTATAIQLFGQEAGSGMAAMIKRGSAALLEMEAAITGTNKAAEMSRMQMNTLQGAIAYLQSAWEALMITIGGEQGFGPGARRFVEGLVGQIGKIERAIAQAAPAIEQFGESLSSSLSGAVDWAVRLGQSLLFGPEAVVFAKQLEAQVDAERRAAEEASRQIREQLTAAWAPPGIAVPGIATAMGTVSMTMTGQDIVQQQLERFTGTSREQAESLLTAYKDVRVELGKIAQETPEIMLPEVKGIESWREFYRTWQQAGGMVGLTVPQLQQAMSSIQEIMPQPDELNAQQKAWAALDRQLARAGRTYAEMTAPELKMMLPEMKIEPEAAKILKEDIERIMRMEPVQLQRLGIDRNSVNSLTMQQIEQALESRAELERVTVPLLGDIVPYLNMAELSTLADKIQQEGELKAKFETTWRLMVWEPLTASMESWWASEGVNIVTSVATTIGKAFITGFNTGLQSNPLAAAILGALGGAGIGATIGALGGPVGAAAGAAIGAGAGVAAYGISKAGEVIGESREQAKKSVEIREEQRAYLDFLEGPSKYYVPSTTIGPAEHALGGLFSTPHLGLVAEAGTEAVIPLSARLRTRALDLWQQVGVILGTMPEVPGLAGRATINPLLDTLPRMSELAWRATIAPAVGALPKLPELTSKAIYQAEAFAAGGILTRPHLGLVAEAGPEAIVPLADGMRTRATGLWQEVGVRLGVLPELPMLGGTAEYQEKMISEPVLPSLMGVAYYQTVQGAMPEIHEIKSRETYDVAISKLSEIPTVRGQAGYDAYLDRIPDPPAMRGQATYDAAMSTMPMLPKPEKQATYRVALAGMPALPALSGLAEYQIAMEQLSNLPELYSKATYSVALGGVPNPPAMREMASYQARIEMLPELPGLTGFGSYQMGLDSQPALSPLAGLGTYQVDIGPLPGLPGLPGAARYSTMPFSQTALPGLTGMAQYQTNLAPGPSLPELRGAVRYMSTMDTLPAMATGGLVDYPVLAGEAGPEAIIPLSATYRSRALDLWLETGEDLGVEGYQEGGFMSRRPTAAFAGSTEVNIDLGGINIGPISANDLETVEERVHEEVRNAFRQVIVSLQNRT